MVGAAIAAAAIRNWTDRQGVLSLSVAQAVGPLCVAVAVYILYSDIYDFYLDAGDSWGDHIGWGIVFTIVSALMLTGICALQYRRWRTRRAEIGSSSPPNFGLLSSVALVVVLWLWISAATESKGYEPEPRLIPERQEQPIPSYALKLAGKDAGKTVWGVWLFGVANGKTCFGTSTKRNRRPEGTGEVSDIAESYCGLKVPLRAAAQYIAGGNAESQYGRESTLVFLTARSVARLDVLISQRPESDRASTWARVKPRTITKRQAYKARLNDGIGYAVITSAGGVCIRQMAVYNKIGKLIERSLRPQCMSQSVLAPS